MKAFLLALIIKIVEFFMKLKPSIEEGAGVGNREKWLRNKIKKEGWGEKKNEK